MDNNEQKIADGTVVAISYVLEVDGKELDRADDDDPMYFLQGHQNIIPGLEKELYGLSVGDTKQVTVAPEEAYGVADPDKSDAISRSMLPDDYEPEIGDPLQLRDTESGEVFQVYVSDIEDERIVVDFNHPLAGETLNFAVKIVEVRPASSEELAHGHVHGSGGHH